MENPKNQLASKLKEASNVLITVSTNPSVDQLAAAIGLTLFMTKLKKHSTTVFSGQVPSIIDFLKPEEAIEDNTDSLRDFIISLDKNKADKIRYKVEDTMVKIFITPYRTSIGDQDLVFSQGDFNVDVVIALGIHNTEDLDQAITAHGRILHDATVATVNLKEGSGIGQLNWTDEQASSLCEMAVALTDLMKANSLDTQMATAFLTGIVAETERFSNEKTSSTTMNASAKLMAAGANQQLIATKLEPPEEDFPKESNGPQDSGDGNGDKGGEPEDISIDDDGSLRIEHESTKPEKPDEKSDEPRSEAPSDSLPEPVLPEPEEPEELEEPENPLSQVDIDDQGELKIEEPREPQIKQDHRHFLNKTVDTHNTEDMFGLSADENKAKEDRSSSASTKLVTEPPQFGGQLSAAADDSSDETSPLNLPPLSTPMLSHDSGAAKRDEPEAEKPKSTGQAAEQEPDQPEEIAKKKSPEPAEPAEPHVDADSKTLDDTQHDSESSHAAKRSKLPEPFVKSLDDSTLSGIEEKIDSPHLKALQQASPEEHDYHEDARAQVAKVMSDKTLNEIEEKVGSPHLADGPKVTSGNDTKKDEGPKLSYEPHESEPPESSSSSGKDPADLGLQLPGTDTPPKSEEARDAVMQAISNGGDGRTSPEPRGDIATSGRMEVTHEATDTSQPIAPQRQEPSPNIDIDDKGNLTSAPPPLPPPMIPPSPQ